MSKKRKKTKTEVSDSDKTVERELPVRPAPATDEPLELEDGPLHLEDATAAAAELDEDALTRGIAAAEIDEDDLTRSGRDLEDAQAAVAELSEDLPTRTADGLPAPRFEQRFDFGGDSGPLRVGPDGRAPDGAEGEAVSEPALGDDETFDEPPDPGSADAASPRLQSIVESLLFAADRPMSLRQVGDLVEEPEVERVRAAVLAIEQAWRERGVQLHEVAGGYQFRTHPQNAMWVQKLLQAKPVRLSRALLETLAIVSYRQPITRPEIDEIRGVDSGGTLKTLMDRALVRILGKKEEPGRPLLYGTTKEFLEFFSLRDLKDLPTLREYHELSEEHQAQVAALEGAAPEGSILPDGEPAEDELPKLSRLEVSAPAKEDAEELAEIDRMIRNAGSSIATDSDLPGTGESADPVAEPDTESGPEPGDDLVVTGKYNAVGERLDAREFDEEERQRTHTFGEPLPEPAPAKDFEVEEATRLRLVGVDASLVDGRDPTDEPDDVEKPSEDEK